MTSLRSVLSEQIRHTISPVSLFSCAILAWCRATCPYQLLFHVLAGIDPAFHNSLDTHSLFINLDVDFTARVMLLRLHYCSHNFALRQLKFLSRRSPPKDFFLTFNWSHPTQHSFHPDMSSSVFIIPQHIYVKKELTFPTSSYDTHSIP